jgi:hypothetical protein
MDETQLRKLRLADLSGLRHETFSSDRDPIPEFLVLRYFGAYRDGSEGRGDALYIVATAEAARKAWYSRCTVLDFRELEYRWGDEMEWVTSIGWNPVISDHEPLGIVVGEKCRGALKSLLGEKYEQHCVETLEEAFALCRRQELGYKQHLKDWRKCR